jgi:hypothetical protein
MPSFDPFQDASTAALVAAIAALEARVALLESVVVIDSSGQGVTLTAGGKLKLASVFAIDVQTPLLDASSVTVKCDRLLANTVIRGGQPV